MKKNDRNRKNMPKSAVSDKVLLKRLRIKFCLVMMLIVVAFLLVVFSAQYISNKNTMATENKKALEFALQRFEKNNSRGQGGNENIPGGIPGGFDNNQPPQDNWNDNDQTTQDNGKENSPNTGEGGSDSDKQDDRKGFRYNYEEMADFRNRGEMNELSKVPVLCVLRNSEGNLIVERNDIFFIENEDSETLVKAADATGKKTGVLSDYKIRFMKLELDGGNCAYAFADISSEIKLLNSQIIKSIWISLAVAAVLFVISILLAKWATRPVERAFSDQRRFIADASHELKTPLAVIISNTDMVVKSDDLSDKNKRRMDNVKAESARMKELVQELIDLARGEASGNKVSMEEVNYSDLLEEDTMGWEAPVFDAGKSLITEIELDVVVKGNRDKLRQLADILIDNALKYSSPASEITVSLKTKDKGKDKRSVTLAVKNQGAALSEEEKTKIFERFYRSDESRESTPGYGLGLSIALQLADLHGGRLSVESCEENGKNYNIFKFKMYK